MLDNLLEIEIAYNMLKVGDDTAKDPIDLHYQKLKTDIQVSIMHVLLWERETRHTDPGYIDWGIII